MKKSFLLFIYAIILTGCASNPSKLAPTTFNLNSSNGLMIGTITIIDEKPRFNSYDFFYRPINEKKIIESISNQIKADLKKFLNLTTQTVKK